MSELLTPQLLNKLERLELVSRKIFRGRLKGERKSRRKGQSVEFTDFRNYVPGDDLRFIDWNLYARLDRLFLKLFLEEEDLHFYALIDSSNSMDFGDPTKLHYAKQLAAALGFIGLCRSDRVRISGMGEESQRRALTLRGRHQLWRMLEYLEKLEPGENVPLLEGIQRFCVRCPGRGIVVLISDLLDKSGYEAALRLLIAREMDIFVFQVMTEEEWDPPLTGDLELVDSEDGDEAEISVSRALLRRYRETVTAFVQQAKEFCTRRGMTHLLARTDIPVDQFVGNYLRERGLVR